MPEDYHPKLVFRSAIESIRGSYIASAMTKRQGLVQQALEVAKGTGAIADFQPTSSRQRFDFEVSLTGSPREMAAIEVKGGEGNSINISQRPLWASEFALWCHLDGAIVNEPSYGVSSIIFNRVASEMVKRGKHVDMVFFRDALCNTAVRPCPKCQRTRSAELGAAPDVFLMPQRLPTENDPKPPFHTMDTVLLPTRILKAYGVAPDEFEDHLWQVSIGLTRDARRRLVREISVYHKGQLVESRRSAR
ncbi:MAG: hypothetical protein M1531_06370 [Chloroflexi bacterium]|nr:hypothetical protein [Chloroflexota bacterium]